MLPKYDPMYMCMYNRAVLLSSKQRGHQGESCFDCGNSQSLKILVTVDTLYPQSNQDPPIMLLRRDSIAPSVSFISYAVDVIVKYHCRCQQWKRRRQSLANSRASSARRDSKLSRTGESYGNRQAGRRAGRRAALSQKSQVVLCWGVTISDCNVHGREKTK